MNKFMNMALVSVAILLASCTDEEVAVEPPSFLRAAHVENCLPALYALDTLAAAAGSQAGQRVPMAPWLRIDHQTIAYRDSVNLTAKSLGPVIMPMLALAQKGLSAEIATLSEEQISAWQSEFGITKDAESFSEYCSREAAFAQWRDAEQTIPWLLEQQLLEDRPNWFQRIFGGSRSNTVNNAEQSGWLTYFDEPKQPRAKVSLVKDINDQLMIADISAMVMLDRYSPRWNIVEDAGFSLGSAAWQQDTVVINDAPAVYAYIDYGVAMDMRFARLNYVSLWRNSDKVVGHIYRISVGFNGKPFAYELMNLDGKHYNLYLAKGLEATNLPKHISAQEIKAVPTMGIFFDKDMNTAEVRSSSGTTEQTLLELVDFDQLLRVDDHGSAFDKDGVLLFDGSYSRLKSWLSGIPKVGLPRHPQKLVVDTQRELGFVDTDLLSQFGVQLAQTTP